MDGIFNCLQASIYPCSSSSLPVQTVPLIHVPCCLLLPRVVVVVVVMQIVANWPHGVKLGYVWGMTVPSPNHWLNSLWQSSRCLGIPPLLLRGRKNSILQERMRWSRISHLLAQWWPYLLLDWWRQSMLGTSGQACFYASKNLHCNINHWLFLLIL